MRNEIQNTYEEIKMRRRVRLQELYELEMEMYEKKAKKREKKCKK